METKHVIYESFNDRKKLANKKKLINFLKFDYLLQKYPFLDSLTNNYNYSYKKKKFKKFKKIF